MRNRHLVLAATLPPPSGGIAAHVLDLAQAARRAGASVRLADVRPGASKSVDGLRLVGELASARVRDDLVHLHTNGHNAGSWRLALVVAALARDPILTVHSGLAPAFIAEHRGRVRAIARSYAHVLAVNPRIAEALADAGVPAGMLSVATPFDGTALPRPVPPPGIATLRRAHRVLVAATLAVGPEYGADLLLDGFARLGPEAGLIVYGPAADDPGLRARIYRDARLAGRVHRYADLDRAAALGVLAAADVFVRPTLTDGDAVSVREALALGVRVVASDAAPRPAEVTLYPSGDAGALAAAIGRALEGPAPSTPPVRGLDPVLALYRAAGVAAPAQVQPFPAPRVVIAGPLLTHYSEVL